MQVGGLGFVNSIVIQKSGELPAQENGFASILTGMVQPLNSSLDAGKTVNAEVQQAKKQELTGLEQLSSTSDLTVEDLISAIMSILNGINLETNEADGGLSEAELLKIIEELPQMEPDDALNEVLHILPFLNIDQITLNTNQSIADLTKSLKLLELLSNNEKTGSNQQKLKELLQKTNEKLETLLKENVSTSRREFLYKVFTPVVKEMNQQTLLNQQTQSVSTATNQLVGVAAGEKVVKNQNNKIVAVTGEMLLFQQMSKPEQLTLMLDKSGQPVSTEKLIQQFEDILSKSQFFKTEGTQKLFIKLNPDHLGALRVELIQKDQALIAKIMTTTSTAKDILESQIQSLKNAFSSQNIQVERIEISQQMNQQERFLNRDSQQQQEQKQQSKQEEQKQHEQQFSVSFEEELINAEV